MDFLNPSWQLCKSLLITIKLHINWVSNADVSSYRFYDVAPDLFEICSTFASFLKWANGEIWRWIQQSLGSDGKIGTKITAINKIRGNSEKKGLTTKTWAKVKLEIADIENGSFQRRGGESSAFPSSISDFVRCSRQEQLTHRPQFHCDNGEKHLWCSNVMMAVPQLLVEVAGGRGAGTSVQENQ